jgi:hypothetical protein
MNRVQKYDRFFTDIQKIYNDRTNVFSDFFNSLNLIMKMEKEDSPFKIEQFDTFFGELKPIYNLYINSKANYTLNKLPEFFSVYKNLLINYDEINTQYSVDFNIFQIIKFNRPEEYVHSPFIKFLLDPSESHGQKDLFYKSFLQTFLPQKIADKFINDNIDDYYVKDEQYIKIRDGRKGEIDIYVESLNPNKRFGVIIENKWESSDSCINQIEKYYKSLSEIGYKSDQILLIYLDKYGFGPQKITTDFKCFLESINNKTYFAISYQNQIKNWLVNCLPLVKSQIICRIIKQYLKTL